MTTNPISTFQAQPEFVKSSIDHKQQLDSLAAVLATPDQENIDCAIPHFTELDMNDHASPTKSCLLD
eukprot:1714992-Rhodomonas_salina.3